MRAPALDHPVVATHHLQLPLHVDIAAAEDRPVAGEDDDPAVGVGLEAVEGGQQERRELKAKGIALGG